RLISPESLPHLGAKCRCSTRNRLKRGMRPQECKLVDYGKTSVRHRFVRRGVELPCAARPGSQARGAPGEASPAGVVERHLLRDPCWRRLACCPTTCRRGARSPVTGGPGASTAPGSGSTRRGGSACA